jgi:hypothetical protein
MQKMNKTYLFPPLFFGLVLLMAVTSVNAQDLTLEQLDTDQDGKISIKEAVADPVLLASFGRIDTDGDGKISKDELAAAEPRELIKESKH